MSPWPDRRRGGMKFDGSNNRGSSSTAIKLGISYREWTQMNANEDGF
jgi:hypothetical protein